MDSLGWPAAAVIIGSLLTFAASVTGIIVTKIMAARPVVHAATDHEAVEHLIERFVQTVERAADQAAKRLDSTRFNIETVATLKEWSRNADARLAKLENRFDEINGPLTKWAMTVGPDRNGPH